MNEEIQALNRIVAIVDDKASLFKKDWRDMPKVRAVTERKLILDLIGNALQLAKNVKPSPTDLLGDLQKLKKEFENLPIG
ncbi:hypothetical protein ACE5IS_16025 [Leptospira wolffii]|uniref:Uncharacterized protein n=1 Tax=Leptospira wolffii TaxID=409998 RepID=A0A2M9ZBE9_9LEPT|nr:hypothetical protein [Leptospira wolffii]EPG67048.1 hypothetical protein LEP1GSC061_1359 [Leptospira wolffii serovar Khorat str. Khorat-H2]PJZ65682.1 hypothetical protein CH371_12205 [Leptospira wolffii]TGK56102.1 hypothetical protein EHQ32_16960 [Leptospira wolffii]TGK72148.1 hypothetical protein EHQ35_12395 [Leptospira wolffii]TGK77452.1 hypothetical protein EHQ27_01940 [Leptospira wolffii]